MRILVVDSEARRAATAAATLRDHRYVVEVCASADEALDLLEYPPSFELVVVDGDSAASGGLRFCRELRRRGAREALLMLSARADVVDKVVALDAGADDYLTRPVHPAELVARTRALLRRCSGQLADGTLVVGPLRLDERRRLAHIAGRRLQLTQTELSLLAYLVRRGGETLTRGDILAAVWGSVDHGDSNVVDVHVRRVRVKLGPLAAHLETVRGVGYRFDPDGLEDTVPRERAG
jgi:two-component system copper resistance phosphate regulon response regulator CusR